MRDVRSTGFGFTGKAHSPAPIFSAFLIVCLLMTLAAKIGVAQTPESAPATPATSSTNNASEVKQAVEAAETKPVRSSDRRRAAKLYLASSKLFEKQQFEAAMRGYEQAARLDPSNGDYVLAARVARSHAVTALIQAAAKDRSQNDAAAARAALAHGLELDPKSTQLAEHLNELGDDALRGESMPTYEKDASTVGEGEQLEPVEKTHSFHLHADQRQILQIVFKAYGIETTMDDSVHPRQLRFDVDDASFEEAARVVSMATSTFYVTLDAHRVLVAGEGNENRQKFLRQELETVYLSGLSNDELADVGKVAKEVFNLDRVAVVPSTGTITLRAPDATLKAFNATMAELIEGRNQVMLDVRLIQLAHTSGRNTGVQPPQSMSAFNVYSEEQSILNANQSLVQQIISSGLASANDPLAILGILVASGQVSSSLFSNGLALFGGGLTLSGLAPGSTSLNLNLNSSDSRELDQMQLRLGDGEDATLRSGTRYPIQAASYGSTLSKVPNIPGLTGAGTSGSLSSLLASYSGATSIPQVQYEDLGLTLKATPKVLRNGDVALKIDMKIDALAGSSIDGNPVLNNRAYSGVVTLKEGEAVEVVSELDKSESRAISGVPGFSEIPGLNDATGKETQKNYASLLIIFYPHVIRGTQAAGHSPMMRIDKGTQRY
ncbi:MAG: hypothetical protein WB425_05600 [Terracidiphilus sp.]